MRTPHLTPRTLDGCLLFRLRSAAHLGHLVVVLTPDPVLLTNIHYGSDGRSQFHDSEYTLRGWARGQASKQQLWGWKYFLAAGEASLSLWLIQLFPQGASPLTETPFSHPC